MTDKLSHLEQDRVFHITSSEHVADIGRVGLLPNTVRGELESWRLAEQLIDIVRPPKIVAMNITRAKGIFAHPYIETLRKHSLGTHNVQRGSSPVVIGIDVDPHKVMVADSFIFDDVDRETAVALETGVSVDTLREATQYAREYWDNAMSLADFRKNYTRVDHGVQGSEYLRGDDAPMYLPYQILSPEVIIPGPVAPGQVEWAASIVTSKTR